jgi:hypothetical protein
MGDELPVLTGQSLNTGDRIMKRLLVAASLLLVCSVGYGQSGSGVETVKGKEIEYKTFIRVSPYGKRVKMLHVIVKPDTTKEQAMGLAEMLADKHEDCGIIYLLDDYKAALLLNASGRRTDEERVHMFEHLLLQVTQVPSKEHRKVYWAQLIKHNTYFSRSILVEKDRPSVCVSVDSKATKGEVEKLVRRLMGSNPKLLHVLVFNDDKGARMSASFDGVKEVSTHDRKYVVEHNIALGYRDKNGKVIFSWDED